MCVQHCCSDGLDCFKSRCSIWYHLTQSNSFQHFCLLRFFSKFPNGGGALQLKLCVGLLRTVLLLLLPLLRRRLRRLWRAGRSNFKDPKIKKISSFVPFVIFSVCAKFCLPLLPRQFCQLTRLEEFDCLTNRQFIKDHLEVECLVFYLIDLVLGPLRTKDFHARRDSWMSTIVATKRILISEKVFSFNVVAVVVVVVAVVFFIQRLKLWLMLQRLQEFVKCCCLWCSLTIDID